MENRHKVKVSLCLLIDFSSLGKIFSSCGFDGREDQIVQRRSKNKMSGQLNGTGDLEADYLVIGVFRPANLEMLIEFGAASRSPSSLEIQRVRPLYS